jgi:hypothetical protein
MNPLSGKPPMMTIFSKMKGNKNNCCQMLRLFLKVSKLSEKEQIKINDIVANLASC